MGPRVNQDQRQDAAGIAPVKFQRHVTAHGVSNDDQRSILANRFQQHVQIVGVLRNAQRRRHARRHMRRQFTCSETPQIRNDGAHAMQVAYARVPQFTAERKTMDEQRGPGGARIVRFIAHSNAVDHCIHAAIL